MDDLIIDRRAQRCRKDETSDTVAFECRFRAMVADVLFSDLVQLGFVLTPGAMREATSPSVRPTKSAEARRRSISLSLFRWTMTGGYWISF
jgi:hypothetical protein